MVKGIQFHIILYIISMLNKLKTTFLTNGLFNLTNAELFLKYYLDNTLYMIMRGNVFLTLNCTLFSMRFEIWAYKKCGVCLILLKRTLVCFRLRWYLPWLNTKTMCSLGSRKMSELSVSPYLGRDRLSSRYQPSPW